MVQDYSDIGLSRSLAEITYPCGKDELLQLARLNGTDEDLMIQLELIPDRVYESPDEALMFADVWEHYLSCGPVI